MELDFLTQGSKQQITGQYMKKLVIGILAHVDAGKTTLSEGILYRSGMLRKIGRVDTVSYTHLDVYKRQIRARPSACFKLCMPRQAGPIPRESCFFSKKLEKILFIWQMSSSAFSSGKSFMARIYKSFTSIKK